MTGSDPRADAPDDLLPPSSELERPPASSLRDLPASSGPHKTLRTLIARFDLVRRLGAGASGTVYEAFDRQQQAWVALKLLNARWGDPLVRFKREFRALQNVRHPNVVSFGELFSDGDEWFFTMELLAGTDLRTYVRRGLGFDELRLRDCIRQLADALATLHATGIVHRDVKPANIVVTGGGRVVLLDFGVVKDGSSPSLSGDDVISFVGTPAYMAPEQISGDAGPATDCYAVGVTLFEALTGRLPFIGKVAAVLHSKQVEVAHAARSIEGGVPLDLSQLAEELLSIDPAGRPNASEIAQRVSRSPRQTSSAPPRERRAVFVGRERELGVLREAWAVAQHGQAACVLVQGESGIGKSTLVQRFVAEVKARDPNTLVLGSRCRETEWIPYKAFDGIIEELGRFLRTLSEAEVATLLPVRAALVAEVFPALMQVASPALTSGARPSDVDAVHQRRRLFAAVRDLIARLAARYSLILVIDDLPWADPDSLALLSEILSGPDAPSFLLLATARDEDATAATPLGSGRHAAEDLPFEIRKVRLGPLGHGSAMELARMLSAREEAKVSLDATSLAKESAGHPLFLQELVRHAATSGSTTQLKLDDAIAERIALLEPAARELLECVALAARPMTRAVLVRATSLGGHDTYRFVNLLSTGNLVRMAGQRAEGIEPFHDRVRQAVLRAMSPGRKIRRHRRIAAALESLHAKDTEALAYHFREAGRKDRAAAYAEQAATEAARAFAFDQAASLYRMAIDLGEPSRARRSAMLAQLGDALANGGRSAQAATAYREAAAHTGVAASAIAGAGPEVLRREGAPLLQRAADQLMRAGALAEGLSLAYAVLEALGMRPPRASWRVLCAFVVFRFIIGIRGVSFRERGVSELSATELAKIDVTWSITSALCTLDPIRGAFFQVRHMKLALRAGEPYRVVRALAMQIVYAAGPGKEGLKRSARFAAQCRAISERTGNAHGVALTEVTVGTAAYLHGQFAEALTVLDRAEKLLRACPGTWGEIARGRRFALSALANLGKIRELRDRRETYLADALAHGDKNAMTNLAIGHANLVWLAKDDPEAAIREATDAMADWTLPGFQVEHFYALYALSNAELYAGRPEEARSRQLAAWRRLERAHLLRIPPARLLMVQTRARAAIAIAEQTPGAHEPLLREAERYAKQIAREPLPFAAPTSILLVAGIAAARGKVAAAMGHLADAAVRFDAQGMALQAEICRRQLGVCKGGLSGEGLVRAADEAMVVERIDVPARMAAMFAPGFRRLGG